jgi:uncharacterized repeat protein (TIGR03803 family)
MIGKIQTQHSLAKPNPRLRGGSPALLLAILIAIAVVLPSSQAQTFIVLHTFMGGSDGGSPAAGLILDAEGNLYGTNYSGGELGCGIGLGCGTVFELDPAGKETILHKFTGSPDGTLNQAGLIRDAAGNLYGTTYGGGVRDGGTVFKVEANGKESVLYSFTGPPDGFGPVASLVADANGNLYGTTYYGGNAACGYIRGCGTVFKLEPSGKETVLHAFVSANGGYYPAAGLIRDSAGNLYGTTYTGGANGFGTVFRLDSAGHETVLHAFTGGTDGGYPLGSLIASGSLLFGTSGVGGAFAYGAVFKLDKAGNETVLYSFTGGADGRSPLTGLVHDSAGNLYGATEQGGDFHYGTVFKLDRAGNESVLHSFTYGSDGAFPVAGVVLDAAGNIYGTTNNGGTSGEGIVFKIVP